MLGCRTNRELDRVDRVGEEGWLLEVKTDCLRH